jgi:hypothetical protein
VSLSSVSYDSGGEAGNGNSAVNKLACENMASFLLKEIANRVRDAARAVAGTVGNLARQRMPEAIA